MRRFILPLLVCFAVIFVSCNTTKPNTQGTTFNPDADRAELIGSTWTLDRLYGQQIDVPAGRNAAYLTFTEDGKVHGHTGCNPINGTYTLEDGLRLSFGTMATGLALCSEIGYEQQFLAAIDEVDNYTLTNGTLSLNKARMAPLAVLQKTDPDQVNTNNPTTSANDGVQQERSQLVGTTWTIDRLFGKQLSVPQGGTKPNITFTADGKVHGNAGCNTLTGTYTLQEGMRIRFHKIATTRMMCPDISYESQFLEVLNTVDNYTISNGELSLNKARMAPLAVLKKGS